MSSIVLFGSTPFTYMAFPYWKYGKKALHDNGNGTRREGWTYERMIYRVIRGDGEV